jgi:hypothetical protein
MSLWNVRKRQPRDIRQSVPDWAYSVATRSVATRNDAHRCRRLAVNAAASIMPKPDRSCALEAPGVMPARRLHQAVDQLVVEPGSRRARDRDRRVRRRGQDARDCRR